MLASCSRLADPAARFADLGPGWHEHKAGRDRGWRYVVAVKGTTSAYAGDAQPVTPARGSSPGRPRKPAYPAPAVNLRQLAIACAGQIRQVTWRQGTKASTGNPDASMTSHFLAIRVRPANRDISRAADGSLPDCWLLAEWPPHADEPTDYWLSNLPAGTPVSELVRLAKIRWRVEHDYRELKTGLGLDHFEGRSFTGWHRHVTLAALAQAFCTLLRADPKSPCAGMSLYQVLHELQIVLAVILGACPLCAQPLTLDRLAAALAAT